MIVSVKIWNKKLDQVLEELSSSLGSTTHCAYGLRFNM